MHGIEQAPKAPKAHTTVCVCPFAIQDIKRSSDCKNEKFERTKVQPKSSTTVLEKEDKTDEFDKELMDESREVLKIYKLLQRMKQSNNTVY